MRSMLPSFALLVALGFAGCGGSESPVAPAPLYPYDGNWVGQTSDRRQVRIGILNSVVVRFEAEVRSGTFCSDTLGGRTSVAGPIANRAFSLKLSLGTTRSAVTVEGRLDTDRTLSGTIGAMEFFPGYCTEDKPFSTPALTFTAAQ